MKFLKEMVRGLLIGVAGIVPGVSGGTLAVSMGVYDQIIGAVTHLFGKPGESIRILFPYGAGMLAGSSMLCPLSFFNMEFGRIGQSRNGGAFGRNGVVCDGSCRIMSPA